MANNLVKPPIPPKYLAKKGGQWHHVSLLNLSIMLLNTYTAARDELVGFEDARETLESLTMRFNKMRLIDPNHIESMLWSCNLLNEQGKFVHYDKKPFDDFVRDAFPYATFDKRFNTIEWEKKKI